jgi:arabinogalactan endo-1,4-beta-galactosidase
MHCVLMPPFLRAAGVALLGLIGPGAAVAQFLTFQVDLSVQRAWGKFNPALGDTVHVAGTFSAVDWTASAPMMPSAHSPGVYVLTVSNDVPAGGWVHYKFLLNPGGNSSSGEWLWEAGTNRWFQVPAGQPTMPPVFFNHETNPPPPLPGRLPQFLAGVDVSHLVFFEDRGVVYRENGLVRDALAILRDRGVNCARLRLFTSSAAQATADPYNYTNNLAYTLPLAQRIKAAGLQLLLDFHYSDTWADPAKQTKPAAWTGLDFAQLTNAIRTYSSNTIAALKAANAMPDHVQVGNEITPGLLWNDGRVGGTFDTPTQWNNLAALLHAAIAGIRDGAGPTPPTILIHIDRGGDWPGTRWFFDNLTARNVPFDVIGLSYYPFWHGTLDQLRATTHRAVARYQRPVVVVETGFPYANSTNIHGFPASTNGQVIFLTALAEAVRSAPRGGGAGIFWWAAEYQQVSGHNLAGFDRRSLFGTTGNVLPAAAALGRLAAPVVLTPARSASSLELGWPLSGAGLSLNSTTSLAPGSVWQPVPASVSVTNLEYRTTVPVPPESNHFFRLHLP